MSLDDELAFVTLDSHGHLLFIETHILIQTHNFNAQAALQRRMVLPPFFR